MCNVEKKFFKATQQNEKIKHGENFVYEFGLMLNLNGVQ